MKASGHKQRKSDCGLLLCRAVLYFTRHIYVVFFILKILSIEERPQDCQVWKRFDSGGMMVVLIAILVVN